MPSFSVEFKVRHVTATSSESRHVKTVLEDPARVAALVQDATAQGGGLEFLIVRQQAEKKPAAPTKQLLKETK
jgi:hypothetical protein